MKCVGRWDGRKGGFGPEGRLVGIMDGLPFLSSPRLQQLHFLAEHKLPLKEKKMSHNVSLQKLLEA